MENHEKNRWKTFAPVLLAVLMAVCVGVSLTAYTPMSYEVQAMPPMTESDDGGEMVTEAEPESRGPEEDDDDSVADILTESIELLSVEDAAAYRDGVYYGSAMGFRGNIEVRVVIEDGKIVSVSVVSASDDEAYLSRAEGLISDIIASQSTNVDTVSGATYSSVGIINAVRNALSKAAVSEEAVSEVTGVETVAKQSDVATFSIPEVEEGETGSFPFPDGTYYGTGWGYLDGEIVAAVEIKNSTIVSVRIVSAQDQDEEYLTMASALTDIIVTAQSADVDVVSGATYSSNGILEAVRNALDEAQAAAGTSSGAVSLSSNPGAGSAGTADVSTGGESGNGGNTGDAASGGDDSVTGGSVDPDDPDQDGNEEGGGSDREDRLYSDGTYEVTVACDPDEKDEFDSYEITIAVTVEGDRIVGVERLSEVGAENATYVDRAWNGYLWRNTIFYPGIPEQVTALAKGNVTEESVSQVDVVTSATCTSKSIKEACCKALRQAAEALEAEREEESADQDDDSDENSLSLDGIAGEAAVKSEEKYRR